MIPSSAFPCLRMVPQRSHFTAFQDPTSVGSNLPSGAFARGCATFAKTIATNGSIEKSIAYGVGMKDRVSPMYGVLACYFSAIDCALVPFYFRTAGWRGVDEGARMVVTSQQAKRC